MSLFSGFANIGKVPELRKRVLFTLGMLAVYRVGVFVTIPGVDRNVMQAVVRKQGAGLLGLFNMFSGGALSNLSIFALGIMPYVSASIILQLLAMVYKPLDELRKEGEQGTRKINQYTRYGTIVLSLMQGFGIAEQRGPRGCRARRRRRHSRGLGLSPHDDAHADDGHRVHDVGR
jgi:preprotein translocase subunit SecY